MNRFNRSTNGVPIIIFLSVLWLVLVLLANPVAAATVYGRVICPNNVQCPARITLKFYQGANLVTALKTDQNGNYRVFLNPGQYVVKIHIKPHNYQATIQSAANPIRQDIRPRRQ